MTTELDLVLFELCTTSYTYCHIEYHLQFTNGEDQIVKIGLHGQPIGGINDFDRWFKKKEKDGKRLLPNYYNETNSPKYEMDEMEDYLLIKIIYQHTPHEELVVLNNFNELACKFFTFVRRWF